ncbi:MAG: aminoacyl-tRNA hydrolase [Treponema sp.]|nr:aminoacyl-tRNA hydrolase [Treponema sp.]MCL2272446.1 aminoacyl-tRNA hydrolase [Treponema sp.]
MIKLAAFLGNPGKKYANTRHNAGRMLAEALPFYPSIHWQKKFKGLYAVHENIQLIIPENYMNLSGESVFAAASFLKIDIKEIIVIHDELELPPGIISLKYSGGLGGHNGLRSMKKCFGSADFWRLRIGIGRPDKRLPGEGGPPGSGEGIIDWVLTDFLKTEQELLSLTLHTAADLLTQTFINEPDTLLSEWKKKKISLPEIQEENF